MLAWPELLEIRVTQDQNLLDSLNAHIAVLDTQGVITATNRAWDQFAHDNGGAQLLALRGNNYFDACAHAAERGDDIAQQALAGMREVLSSERDVFTLEYPCHSPAQRRWFVLHVTRRTDGSDGLITAHEDITAWKLAEEQLRRERDLSLRYLEVTAVMIVALNAQGEVTLINRKGCEVLGYPEAEILGKNWLEYFIPDTHKQEIKQVFEQLIAGNVAPVSHYENSILTRDGCERLIAWNNNYLQDDHGCIIGIISSGEDITEHAKTETALRQSEARFRAIFDGTNDVIFLHEPVTGRILQVSAKISEIYGYTAEEAQRLSLEDLSAGIVPYTLELALDWMAKAMQGQQPVFEWLARHKDGHLFWVEVSMRKADIDGTTHILVTVRDISERKRMEQALIQEALSWTKAMDQFDDVIYLLDTKRRLVRANKAFLTLTGSTLENMVGRHIAEIIHPQGEAIPCPVCLAQEEMRDAVITMEAGQPDNPSGKPIEIHVKILRDDHQATGILMSLHDLTVGRWLEEKLRLSAAVFSSTHDGVMITDAHGNLLTVNRSFTQITGYSEAETQGKNPRFLRSERHDNDFYHVMWRSIQEVGVWQGEIWNRRKNGEIYPEWLTISAVRDAEGQIRNYIGVFSDITWLKQSEEKLEHLAHHDALTNLPNRLLLNSRLEHAIDHARRQSQRIAVLFLDLDRFKNINDSLGHPVGDELLKSIATRLQQRLRDEDTLARLGGDEFIILIEQIGEPQDATIIARDLLEALTLPFSLSSKPEVYIGGSIGISLYPDDGDNAAQLIRNADAAMYQAKNQGRNTYRFYTQSLTNAANRRLSMESDLRRALERGEFVIHYQPQVRASTGAIIAVEALIRWQHPDLGLLSPAEFIPLAEDTGLIVPLGAWVLEAACAQIKQWQAAGLDHLGLAVNISTRQFSQPNLSGQIADILERQQFDPTRLELEVTESALMCPQCDAEATFRTLKNLGISIAIDDFGTGYSSLGYLRRFPIDTLKIDRSFVEDIPAVAGDCEITATIIAMARNLCMAVLAEGVESPVQLAFLQAHGCDVYQGYHFSRALPAEQFTQCFLANINSQRPVIPY